MYRQLFLLCVVVTLSAGQTDSRPVTYLGLSDTLPNLIAEQLAHPQGDGPDGHIQEDGADEELHEDDIKRDTRTTNTTVFTQHTTSRGTPSTTVLTPGVQFEGPGTGIPGYTVTSAPPDTTMAVGPNHIIAWVNTRFIIFSKSGTILAGPSNGNTFFIGGGGLCETTNRGDPILQYDKFADRWILSQFAFNPGPTAPYLQCIAISQSADPLGAYHRYAVSFGNTDFNDYGKVGVWPDGYYFSFNIFGGSPPGGNTGCALCVADRVKMLAGDNTATFLCLPVNFYGGGAAFLPADLDGTTLPSDLSQGGLFIRQSTSPSLRIIKVKPDFTAGTLTTTPSPLGQYVEIPLPATLRACNGVAGACVRQEVGFSNLLDTLGDRLMYRAAFRVVGGIESLVVCQSVDPDGAAARSSVLRWYEIRSPLSATPTLHQVANYDPGAAGDRWMGSVAMDKFGNMLAGYSVINAATLLRASLAVAGRLRTDAVNTLQTEDMFLTGGGVQTGTLTRWGDYTTMQVDPNDATFWFIGQYLASNGTFNWRTRIASFTFVSSSTTSLVSSQNPSMFGQSVTFTATVSGVGATGTVAFDDGMTTLATVPLAGGTASFTTPLLAAATHPITATYSGDVSFTGSFSTVVNQVVTASAMTE